MITVKVTNCTIVESDMVVSCQTTNTAYPDVTLEGVQNEIDGGAKLLWIAYAQPQWNVVA